MSENTSLIDLVKKLPQKPGVYQFLNQSGETIYVGKAKKLRNRVSSYFSLSDSGGYKLKALVRKISDIKYILVENESDALLLENNLIKEYLPKYNILLKDDKTYPWICIKNERFPRVIVTRNYIMDGSEYYGPYTSGFMVRTLVDLIHQLFKLRNCSYQLSALNIEKGKFKRCLEFHMGNCLGPCEGLQGEEDYNQSINDIREILKGNLHSVVKHLRSMMVTYSSQLLFEEAEIVKNKIEILEKFQGKSTIVNPKIRDMDVFSMIDDEDCSFVNFLKIVNGAIVMAHNTEVVKRLVEDKSEILGSVIFDLRKRFSSHAREVIVPFKPDIIVDDVLYTIPLKGDKKRVLDLSFRNATSFRADKMASKLKDKWAEIENKVLVTLMNDLKMNSLPTHIECFDNSNTQGSEPVASCVVFKSGKPYKSAYRHFNIKTVTGQNDFASMEEVVGRRYKRMIEQNEPLPDLIIIDGGKGQLSSTVRSLKSLGLYGKTSIISIAKRLEEIYLPDDPIPLYLDKTSASLKLIQRIRDEAHRFGISFHRNKRSKSQLQSAFTSIKGVGTVTRDKLLKSGIDLERLKEMSLDEIKFVAGEKASKAIYEYFRTKGD